MTRGGKREGAGRPFGTKKEPTVVYYRRVKPEWVKILDELIESLKNKKPCEERVARYIHKYEHKESILDFTD